MKENRFRAIWANFVIVTMLVTTFGIAFAVALPADGVTQTINNAIYEGDGECEKIALMFNVYENAANVEKIAKIIGERGHNCTFFVGGSWAAKNPNTLLKVASNGFEIGNHGYLHRDHAKLTLKQNTEEIVLTERLIDGILDDLPNYENSKLFAPPSGSIGDIMFDACRELGYKVIMWTRDTIDWRDHDADLIYERAIRDVKAGDLILMHPTDWTVAALPRILDYIESIGLSADTVGNVIE
ncbi:MAG: polysaccharide deacetylase family protein [Bacteroides sp.]|nr:polysaccharide deacetylase family protein [Bacillota bacterium]MCM1393996.1 polysaccharide deacetylase family protein [[Eubacterium] siraeum]MCM1455651.1 polysaccharide deacetylase family protein [Bacteroides sp.]